MSPLRGRVGATVLEDSAQRLPAVRVSLEYQLPLEYPVSTPGVPREYPSHLYLRTWLSGCRPCERQLSLYLRVTLRRGHGARRIPARRVPPEHPG